VLIEDKASGQSLIQEIRRETSLPLIPVKVDTDKISRAYSITPTIESGRVFLPKAAPWLHDFIEELSAFPNGEHDDQVDSLTQALHKLTHSSRYGFDIAGESTRKVDDD
jgi:predicted phage terminase large subunit-like protein